MPSMMEIQYKRVRDAESCPPPNRLHQHDAAFDLTVTRYVAIAAGAKVQLSHNLSLAIPAGYYGLILPRSSTFTKKGLIVHPGIIDSGYRGEVVTAVYNPTGKMVHVGDGDRISQLLILPIPIVDFVHAKKSLPPGDRGEDGFGSTGGFSG
jgi:dUTP pyrophosphatase